MRFRKPRVLLGTYVFILLNVTTLCTVIVVLGQHLNRQYVATGSEVPADCRTVCAGTNGNRTCVPLSLAAMVYENDVPLTSLNFQQNHFPAVSYIGKKHSSRRTECSLERHFPGRSLLPKQGRCAVVGNGGVLRGSGCGADIDAHDFVLRCNMAPTEGYESDVGRKANLWGINMATLERVSSVIWSHWNSERKKDYDLFIKHIQNPDGTIIWYPKGMSKNHDTQFLQIINTARKYSKKVRFAYNWSPIHIERDWRTIRYATMGLNVVALAQTFCSHISLYGFYPFHHDSRGRKVSYHYYDDFVYEYSNENHDFPVEYRKLQSLAKEGKIDLFTEPCKP